jgi:hypothetical protein
MATERQGPDGVLDSTNYSTANLADIQDDPDSPDGVFWTWDANGNTICRVSFPTPSGSPTVGADLQEFRAEIRRDGGTGSNSVDWSLELWENGVLDSVLATGTTTSTSEVISGTWNASSLGTADGSLVELALVQTAGGSGQPATRRGLEVGAVEWNVDYVESVLEGTASDTAAVTDSVVVALEYEREITDTAVVTDACSGGLDIVRTITDAPVSVADALAVALEHEREITDTAVVTDSLAIELEYEREITDTAVVTDQAIVVLELSEITAVVSDTAVVTDAVATALEYEREITDTAVVTDSLAIELEYGREITDTVVATDASSLASSIARYLLDEASSGTSPTTCADDGPDGHDLTIDYGTSDAEWTSDSEGNGLDFLDTAGSAKAEIADMSAAGSIGGQLDGEQEMSFVIRSRIDSGSGNGARLFALSTSDGQREIIARVGFTEFSLQFFNEFGLGGENSYTHTGATGDEIYGTHTFVIVFDLAEATQADRCKLYIDGTLTGLTISASTLRDDVVAASQHADVNFTLGNRGDGVRELNGALLYAEVFTGKLSAAEAADIHTALSADHDAAWEASGGATEVALEYEREITDTAAVTDGVVVALEYEREITDTAVVTDQAIAALELGEITAVVSDTAVVTDGVAVVLEYEREITDTAVVTDGVAIELEYGREITEFVGVTDTGLAAATSIARYLLNEASSGTSPTMVADDEGGHDLTIDYGTAHAAWSSNADGNGLDFTDTAGAAIAKISDMSAADSIGGQLDGLKEVSIIMVARIDAGHANVHRCIHLGTNGSNGELGLVFGEDTLELRFAQESGGDSDRAEYPFTSFGNEDIYQFVINTAEAVAADRVKFYLNGSLQTANSQTIEQDDALASQNIAYAFCIGNRGNLNREIDGAIWYVELFAGLLSADELTASRTALLLDHDANWLSALAIELEYEREITDTAVVTDAAATALEYEREITDTAVVTDGVDGTIEGDDEVVRTVSDTAVATDALALEVEYSRALTDTAVVTDSLVVALEYGVAATDTASVADALAIEVEYEREITDAVVVTDALATALEYEREITDTAVVTDGVSIESAGTVSAEVSDTAVTTDALSVALEYEREITDTAVVTDAVATALEYEREVSDTAVVTDGVATALEYEREITDTAVVTDGVSIESAGAVSAEVSDTAVVADALAIELEYARALPDAVSVADALAIELEYEREITDTASVTDQASIEVGISDTDTVAVADLLVIELEYERITSDIAAVLDDIAITSAANPVVEITDAAVVTDSVAAALEYEREITDAVVVTDAVGTILGREREVTDVLAVADALAVVLEYEREVTDAVVVADSVAAGLVHGRSATDAVSVADEVLASATYGRTPTDAVGVTDAVQTAAEYARTLGDSVSAADLLVVTIQGHEVDHADAISVTDAVAVELILGAEQGDTVEVTDEVEVQRTLGGAASDVISVVDSVAVDILFVPPDNIEVTDSVVRAVSYVRDVSDDLDVTDSVYIGDPVLTGHGQDDGVVPGPVDPRTTTSDGPVTASSGGGCETNPVGFVVTIGDSVDYNDDVEVGLDCHVVINDTVGVTG